MERKPPFFRAASMLSVRVGAAFTSRFHSAHLTCFCNIYFKSLAGCGCQYILSKKGMKKPPPEFPRDLGNQTMDNVPSGNQASRIMSDCAEHAGFGRNCITQAYLCPHALSPTVHRFFVYYRRPRPHPQTIKKPLSRLNNDKGKSTLCIKRSRVIVQALTSQGNEVTLFHALLSTWTVYLLIVSPLLRGSNPYPCGSLTYRNGLHNHIYITGQ